MPKTFEEMWEIAKNYGASLEDYAKELYEVFKKQGFSEGALQTIVSFVYELSALDNYLTENKLDADKLPSILRKIRDHKHVDGKVTLPIEVDP